MKKKETYESALVRVQQIVSSIENNEMPLDQLTKELKEAQKLLKYCKQQLLKTETEVNQLLEDVEE